MAWLFTLKAKLIGAGILLALLVWGFRVWLVKHDQAVWQDGRTAGAAEIEKQKRAEWEAKEQAIRVDAAAVDAQRAEAARSRRALEQTLSQSLKRITASREADHAQVIAVPDIELDAALRAISTELAAH